MTIQSEIEHSWGSSGNLQLIAERENAVYKILIKGKPAALRLHRRGYQDDSAIISELLWTTRLATAGFPLIKILYTAFSRSAISCRFPDDPQACSISLCIVMVQDYQKLRLVSLLPVLHFEY